MPSPQLFDDQPYTRLPSTLDDEARLLLDGIAAAHREDVEHRAAAIARGGGYRRVMAPHVRAARAQMEPPALPHARWNVLSAVGGVALGAGLSSLISILATREPGAWAIAGTFLLTLVGSVCLTAGLIGSSRNTPDRRPAPADTTSTTHTPAVVALRSVP